MCDMLQQANLQASSRADDQIYERHILISTVFQDS